MNSQEKITLESFLLKKDGARLDPALNVLMTRLAQAAKTISHEIRNASISGNLGMAGGENPTGDEQKKLDVAANEIVLETFADSGRVAAVVSEELEAARCLDTVHPDSYILCVDPVDGSSNLDINGTVGTIFSFYRRKRTGRSQDPLAELQDRLPIAAAGYVMYGPGTILVFTGGAGVNGFTLDNRRGEFLLTQEMIRSPARGSYYSANLGKYGQWDPNIRKFVDHLTEKDLASNRPYSLRYVGAMVADIHRNLLEGGIFFYPEDEKNRNGKLRLLYECAPMAFLVEQAGGRATTGRGSILDIRPESLHQRVPIAIGSPFEVDLYEKFCREGGE